MTGTPRPRALARRALGTAAALAASLAGLVTAAPAASAAEPSDRCPAGRLCVFQYPNYGGAMKILSASAPTLTADWNDKISSIVNKSGLWATFYTKPRYETDPDYIIVTPHNGAIDLGFSWDRTYDNKISSYRVATTQYEVVQGVPYMDWYVFPEVKRPEGLPAAGQFGDLNNDRRPDLLERADDGRLWWLSGNGDADRVTKGKLIGGGWNSMTQLVRHGDYNGDGREDLFARDTTGVLWFYPGNGAGAFSTRVKIGAGWNTMREISAVGDVTGDGRRDLVARDTTGVLWTYPGNGKGAFGTRKKVGAGWNVMNKLASPGDMTGDGKSDLLARDTDRALWLYPGNGSGAFGARKKLPYGWPSSDPVFSVGDVSGDGHSDILRPINSQLFIYHGTGLGTIKSPWADTLYDTADRVRVF
ncbi:FG-GAP-like repeat-containing protein [Streptomyces bambusae]|uniref:FG-GAP-like repeat-containing protein n=1 Tax=Streptomyces bambusae TaxID=1550616 RepID=UPI001CFC8AFD|nr:FG-GAP-like repeat-containing protein [Streptomyces bambusae]MCB5169034.1 FG-GAP-like repeat-containing protein [Streptomyces bambusae]